MRNPYEPTPSNSYVLQSASCSNTTPIGGHTLAPHVIAQYGPWSPRRTCCEGRGRSVARASSERRCRRHMPCESRPLPSLIQQLCEPLNLPAALARGAPSACRKPRSRLEPGPAAPTIVGAARAGYVVHRKVMSSKRSRFDFH